MAEKENKPDALFYIMVPKVGSQVAHQSILVSQTRAIMDQSTGVQIRNEMTDELVPDGRGLIRIQTNDPNHEARVLVLANKMKRENLGGRPPVLIGPFEDEVEAFAKMHEVRPKTDSEVASQATALAASVSTENSALRERIKELEKKAK